MFENDGIKPGRNVVRNFRQEHFVRKVTVRRVRRKIRIVSGRVPLTKLEQGDRSTH